MTITHCGFVRPHDGALRDREPAYDWGTINEPLRLMCTEKTLLPLAVPQRLEDISFADPDLPPSPEQLANTAANPEESEPAGPPAVEAEFLITAERLECNERLYMDALVAKGVEAKAAQVHASAAARGLAGMGMWPRLVLRNGGARGDGPVEEELVVESRGIDGTGNGWQAAVTSWQTVLPLLGGRPVTVAAGQVVRTSSVVELPRAVDQKVWYSIEYW